MNYLLPDDIQLIMEEAQRGLENLQRVRQKARKSDMAELVETAIRADYGRSFYEPYDADVFEAKRKVDSLFYECLLTQVPPQDRQKLERLLEETYELVRQIYEFVNIRPEIYLPGVCQEILEAPLQEVQSQIANVIYEFLDRNFYRLTPQERSDRYGPAAYGLTMKLLEKGVPMEEASTLALKAVLLERFLRQVAFPFSAWSRVSYLVESEDYAKVFDQDQLIELVNEYERALHRLSALISLHV